MNVLQVLPELNVGGVETGVVDLSKALVKLGHKAVVVSGGGELVKQLENLGAIHYQLPVHQKSLLVMFRMINKIAEIIKKEEIDIVHARSRVPAWAAYFAARKTNRVFITTCHGFYKKHPFSLVMGWGKRVIALSNIIARHMIDDFGVPYERIKLVPRSIDLEKFKYIDPAEKRKADFHVGIIGRLVPIKGHAYFIKAMAKVSRSTSGLKIWIVGDVPQSREAYKEELQILVKRLGLKPATEFLGLQRDIPSILANLDVLVLATTTHEAFGRVIIEAQAAGVPVVATKVGGVVDIIENEKTGLLVPPADPTSMAEAVIRLYKDKKLAQDLSQAAYKKVKEKYTLQDMVKHTLDIYEEALSNFKILLIKFSSLGDVVLSTAAIRAIREKFSPNYKITFLTGHDAKDILLRCPYIDELLVSDLKSNGILGLLKLAARLRKNHFNTVIDLQNNRKSHLLSRLTLALNRYGYENKKFSLLLNHRVKDEGIPLDPVSHQFRILKMLGVDLKEPHLELWPSQEDQRYIDEFLNSQWLATHQKLIGINISASDRWSTKAWPLEQMLKLCEELSRRQMRVVLTGLETDLPEAFALINAAKLVKPINACAKTTINQLSCLIKKCRVYISSDSAPLHIAAAMGTP
ncbi:MAG: GT4 family glycosyltransferase PelF, partial [Candidatus Omnitrophica bacterium]|nr:GT4 family glycosyltransferase PelF [Candidatus Omnitrophota bacterium]